jgi:hypothetical protein
MRSHSSRLVGCLALAVGLVGALPLLHLQDVRAADNEMGGHMTMTELRPVQAGDKQRAEEIVAAARRFADQFTDYRKALADGYTIFHPEIPQKVYHFTNDANALQAQRRFDPNRPTSLLYEKAPAQRGSGQAGYKLVGVMYTAPFQASQEELNRRVPLSIARWHLHSNLCLPPVGEGADMLRKDAKFGLQGSITTAEACQAAGGRFLPHLFGWMVHVYPYESDQAKIWAAGMDDDHGMQHDTMPAGMDMPM